MAEYIDPTADQALASSDYTSQAGLLDEQAGLNEQTYARTRQDMIRSYQDTLDNLSFGLKQAGIQARGQYAGRNLYNASGDLSGTGELVGTELTQPIVRQITSAQARQSSDLAGLAQEEAQGRLNLKSKKADLLNNVLTGLRSRAKETYNTTLDAEKEQKVAKAKTSADNAKLYNAQIEKGRPPLTLKEANRRRAAGLPVYSYRDSNGNLHNFGGSVVEETALRKAQRTGTPKAPTPPSLQRSSVFKNGKQIGFALFNPKTGQTTYTDMGGIMSINPTGTTVGTSGGTQVDPGVYSDLNETIANNPDATLAELKAAFPELDIADIKALGGF